MSDDLISLIGEMEAAFWRWYATGPFGKDLEQGPLRDEYDRLEERFINFRCSNPTEMWVKARYVSERPHLNETGHFLLPIVRSLTGLKGGAA